MKDFQKQREPLTKAHLLLALFYAMQPGAFSFSVSDLLGTLTHQTLDPMEPTENTLYASLPGQMKNPQSFARQLQNLLAARRSSAIQSAELLSVPETTDRGLLLLIHRMAGSGMLQLLAVNFGRKAAQQTIELPQIRHTTAIDCITGLAEKKPLEASTIRLDLPPLSGKVILFQTKYYD